MVAGGGAAMVAAGVLVVGFGEEIEVACWVAVRDRHWPV